MARSPTTSDAFNAVAEPRRRQILERLIPGEMPVNDLVVALGMGQPQVSKHLRVLKEVGLVTVRGEGHCAVSRQSCCSPGPIRSRPARRRFCEFGGWLTPTVVLALLPKCPACLAAYVALGIGVALSRATATQLRTAIVTACLLRCSPSSPSGSCDDSGPCHADRWSLGPINWRRREPRCYGPSSRLASRGSCTSAVAPSPGRRGRRSDRPASSTTGNARGV